MITAKITVTRNTHTDTVIMAIVLSDTFADVPSVVAELVCVSIEEEFNSIRF